MADDEEPCGGSSRNSCRRVSGPETPTVISACGAGPTRCGARKTSPMFAGSSAIHAAVTALFAEYEITGVFTADAVAESSRVAWLRQRYIRGTAAGQKRSKCIHYYNS